MKWSGLEEQRCAQSDRASRRRAELRSGQSQAKYSGYSVQRPNRRKHGRHSLVKTAQTPGQSPTPLQRRHEQACHKLNASLLLPTLIMPTATSSRRKTNGRSRREPSSDGIEDAAPSQGAAEDDVEEEQPSRSARTVKKEKKGGRSAPRPTVDDDDEDDEDAAGEGGEGHTDYDRIDVNNFPDQPLTKDTAPNIKGILSDWDMIRKINTTSAKGALESIGVSMADLMDEDQATKVGVHRVAL